MYYQVLLVKITLIIIIAFEDSKIFNKIYLKRVFFFPWEILKHDEQVLALCSQLTQKVTVAKQGCS